MHYALLLQSDCVRRIQLTLASTKEKRTIAFASTEHETFRSTIILKAEKSILANDKTTMSIQKS